jgi:hypothetical protein
MKMRGSKSVVSIEMRKKERRLEFGYVSLKKRTYTQLNLRYFDVPGPGCKTEHVFTSRVTLRWTRVPQ